jgi:hypothetical protein
MLSTKPRYKPVCYFVQLILFIYVHGSVGDPEPLVIGTDPDPDPSLLS